MSREFKRLRAVWVFAAWLLPLGGCWERNEPKPAPAPVAAVASAPTPAPLPSVPPLAPTLVQPVAFWDHGKTEREIESEQAPAQGALIIDLGEAWTPYLFTDGVNPDDRAVPNAYRPIYLSLARGEYPDNYHGERAKADKFLELFGILPTLHVVRDRMLATSKLACLSTLDLTPLQSFHGLVTYDSPETARRQADDFLYLKNRVHALLQKQHVDTVEQIDQSQLKEQRDKDAVVRYLRVSPERLAVEAMQARFKCEGYYKGRGGKYTRGAMDWATHDALAEFERRNRVFSFGYMGKESLQYLSLPPMLAERDAVLRVLTERATHAAGVLEDGSAATLPDGQPRTFKGADGKQHTMVDLVSTLRDTMIEAFGLQTPESTLAWLESLGKLPKGEHRYVAIKAPPLPEYYSGNMQLTLDYDRGDVWYDFPYGEHGEEVPQPVQRRPQVTVSVLYAEQKIPLARYGTTIGGWRSEMIDGSMMWKYKESPVGPRAWQDVLAAPVWLPPDGTPPEDILKRNRKKKTPEDPDYVFNQHEIGPSYASAYGLVAAYHRTYYRKADGTILLGNDEGIRTHGSVDYMSIMRRHSHGCHRLHNHIALRLMSFVLAHRLHRRLGQERIAWSKDVDYKDKHYHMELEQGGYLFRLDEPILVNVEEGRIRGQVKAPIEIAMPKYNEALGVYLMPDNTAVKIRGNTLVPIPLPITLPDGGVFDPSMLPPVVPPPAAATAPGSLPPGSTPPAPAGGALPAARGPTASAAALPRAVFAAPTAAAAQVPVVRPAPVGMPAPLRAPVVAAQPGRLPPPSPR